MSGRRPATSVKTVDRWYAGGDPSAASRESLEANLEELNRSLEGMIGDVSWEQACAGMIITLKPEMPEEEAPVGVDEEGNAVLQTPADSSLNTKPEVLSALAQQRFTGIIVSKHTDDPDDEPYIILKWHKPDENGPPPELKLGEESRIHESWWSMAGGKPRTVRCASAFKDSLMSDDEIKQAFALFDTDNSGAISTDELRFALTAMGLDVASNDVQEFLKSVDTDGDGTVTLEEFSAMCRSKEGKLGTPDDIKMAFQRLGGNDDPECKLPETQRVDFLTLQGLRHATKQMFGEPEPDRVLQEIITWSMYSYEYDKNGQDIFAAWSEDEMKARTQRLDFNTFFHSVCKYDPKGAEMRRAEQLRLRAKLRAMDEAERIQEAELSRKSSRGAGSQRSSSGNRRDSQKSSGSGGGSGAAKRGSNLGGSQSGTSPPKRSGSDVGMDASRGSARGSKAPDMGGSRKGSHSGGGSAGGSLGRRSAPQGSSGNLRQSSGKAGSDMGGSQSKRSVPGEGSRRGSSRNLQER